VAATAGVGVIFMSAVVGGVRDEDDDVGKPDIEKGEILKNFVID